MENLDNKLSEIPLNIKMDTANKMERISIKEFYKGKDVFITGGLGFLGKVLIEKLLRACGDLNHIYVLVRAKKNQTAQERLDETILQNLFDIIRRKCPSNLEKIIAVNGDVACDGLGLSQEDIVLMKDVSVIFHSAATVRFNEPIKQSILINTKGTHEIMKFAQKLPNLKALVHVSTTYCNLDRMFLEEKVYTPYASWKEMIDAAENNNQKILDEYVIRNRKNKHNTYTLSKHLAEQVANDYRDLLPVLIFRPAIVTPILSDPIPGWVDNWNGPVGLCAGIGAGVVRTFYADPKVYSEYTPVDSSARCMIVAAYAMGTNQARQSEAIPVYNCSRSYKNRQVTLAGLEVLKDNPMQRTLWAPDGTMTSCSIYFHMRFLIFQAFPAMILDLVLMILRYRPFFFKLQKKVYKSSSFMAPFLQTQWDVNTANVKKLDKIVSAEEFEEFGFYDHMKFDLCSYMKNCITGVKKNLLNEPEQCTKATLRKYRMMIIADRIIRLVFYFCVIYFFVSYIYRKLFC